jgi:hypothetical protein
MLEVLSRHHLPSKVSDSAGEVNPRSAAQLPPKNLAELKAWLEDFCEDQLELNDDAKAALERSHNEIANGQYRTRKP